jgi:hypothetical protein
MTNFVNFPAGLELDPAAGLAAGLVIGLAAGFMLGLVHFRTLRLVSDRLVQGDITAIALQLGRFVVLAVALFGLAKLGAVPLLAAMAGIIVARGRVVDGRSARS